MLRRGAGTLASYGRLLVSPGAAGSARSYATDSSVPPAAQQGGMRLGRLAAAAAAAAAAVGLLPVGRAEPAREQQPPSPEELSKPGATSIRTAEGLEGKLSGCGAGGSSGSRPWKAIMRLAASAGQCPNICTCCRHAMSPSILYFLT